MIVEWTGVLEAVLAVCGGFLRQPSRGRQRLNSSSLSSDIPKLTHPRLNGSGNLLAVASGPSDFAAHQKELASDPAHACLAAASPALPRKFVSLNLHHRLSVLGRARERRKSRDTTMADIRKLTALEHHFTRLLARRHTRSLLRRLTTLPPNSVDFSSNDYLSLSTHPDLHASFLSLLQSPSPSQSSSSSTSLSPSSSSTTTSSSPPLGSRGSRLLDGNTPLATHLETLIPAHHRAPAGILFNSGFEANVGIFSSLPQPADVIVFDALIHASVHDGMRLSRVPATHRMPFAHNSVDGLRRVLEAAVREVPGVREGTANVFIGVEAVYSMDGDVAPLVGMLDVVDDVLPRGNGYVVVDEAHATGVFGELGRGLVCELGVEDRVFARVVTFGKALGAQGGEFPSLLSTQRARDYNESLYGNADEIQHSDRPLYPHNPLLPHQLRPHPHLHNRALAPLARPHQSHLRRPPRRQNTTRKPPVPSPPSKTNTSQLLTHLRTLTLRTHSLLHALSPTPLIALKPIPETHSLTPIIPIFTPHPRSLANHCQARGYMVRPIVAPTVPRGAERVRVCLHAGNTFAEVEGLVRAVREWVEGMVREEGARDAEIRTGTTRQVGGGVRAAAMEKAKL